MKVKEIRQMSLEELHKHLGELKENLFTLRMQHAVNQLDNPLKIKSVRRNIARIKTIIRENEQHGA